MKQLLSLVLAAAVLSIAATQPASAAGPSPIRDASTSVLNCHFEWKWKKYFKKVKLHGKVRKVVRYRRVRKQVCPPPVDPGPARIGIKSYEFYFVLSAKTLLSGDTIAELSNQGEDPHDLRISKIDGSDEVALPETLPGGINRARFDTQPGTYRLWCSLPFHAERGMDTTFKVEPAPIPPL